MYGTNLGKCLRIGMSLSGVFLWGVLERELETPLALLLGDTPSYEVRCLERDFILADYYYNIKVIKKDNWLSDQSEHGLVWGTSTYPRYWNTCMFFDKTDIIDSFFRQVLRFAYLSYILIPSFKSLIYYLYSRKIVKVARDAVNLLTIKFVSYTYFYLLERIKDIKLSKIPWRVPVDGVSESNERYI